MTDQASVSNTERAIEDYKKMKEKYDIPEKYEFQILAMLELQWEFRLTSIEHTKRKMDLLKMIQDIDGRLPRDIYSEKKKEEDIINKVKVFIACKSGYQTMEVSELLHVLIGNKNINLYEETKIVSNGEGTRARITTNKYDISIDKFNESLVRGIRFNTYLNLTGESKVEDFLRERVI